MLSLTILRYNDAHSRSLVLDLIKVMFSKHAVVVAKSVHSTILEVTTTCILNVYLTVVLKTYVQSVGCWKNTTATKSLAKPSLAALAWSCAVTDEESLKEEGKKIVETQSLLAAIIFAAGGRSVVDKARKVLELCWTKAGVLVAYVDNLVAAEPSLNVAVLGAQLVQFIAAPDKGDDKKVRTFLTETLTKTLLMSKSKLPVATMKCLSPFLQSISLEEFKNGILPVMNKSLLRSPENALSIVSVIIDGLSLDLSSFAAELGKTFCNNLKSKDDQTREDAIVALTALSRKCSDKKMIEQMVDNIFNSLEGKDGKISLNTVKVSLLTAAGELADLAPELSVVATKRFAAYLREESHEASVMSALEQLTRWTGKYSAALPDPFLAAVNHGLSDKSASSGVRCGYLMCLFSALTPNTRASAAPVAKQLIKVSW